MKNLIYSILACLLSIQVGYAQNRSVIRYQYWISGDGYDSAVTGSVDGENVEFTLGTDGLSQGIHSLNFRVQDSEGVWSALQSWLFYVDERKANEAVEVTEGEYWIDDGARQKITIDDGQASFVADASTVREGLHTLNYRVKDSEGNYSRTYTWAFFKNNQKATKISWCRYWWNNHVDKAVTDSVDCDSLEYVFKKELTVPSYAMTDGYSNNSTARFHIVFGDDAGNVSNTEWMDVSYPDVLPPVSAIEADKEEATEEVTLKWYVKNDQVEDYNVYYSENDQPFVLWMPNTTEETATFKGQPGVSYRFTVTARDKSGNREKLDEEKCVTVKFKSN